MSDDELAVYTGLEASQLYSLSVYIQQSAALFVTSGVGLTTPVSVEPVVQSDASVSGARILFQKVDTGYDDKDDENEEEEETKPKKQEVKQGGVEVLVEKVGNGDLLQVRAQRCEIEEGTMIKEMSEATILKELQKAMDVWKKEHS